MYRYARKSRKLSRHAGSFGQVEHELDEDHVTRIRMINKLLDPRGSVRSKGNLWYTIKK
jgi:hypothetical protein